MDKDLSIFNGENLDQIQSTVGELKNYFNKGLRDGTDLVLVMACNTIEKLVTLIKESTSKDTIEIIEENNRLKKENAILRSKFDSIAQITNSIKEK